MDYSLDFAAISKKDLNIVGDKAFTISVLINKGYPIPKGFVITSNAFYKFLEENGISEEINDLLTNTDVSDYDSLCENSEKIRKKILGGKMPKCVQSEIKEQYAILGTDKDMHNVSKEQLDLLNARQIDLCVAVRASQYVGQKSKISYNGFYKSCLFVNGSKGVCDKVQEIWASSFLKELLYARDRFSPDDDLALAVIVQEMIDADKSGNLSTINPTNDNSDFYIESSIGSGITGTGEITPDIFVVDSSGKNIIGKKINSKDWKFVKHAVNGRILKEKVPPDEAIGQSLSDKEIKFITRTCENIQKNFKTAKLFEWAIRRDRVFVTQMSEAKLSANDEEESGIESIVDKPIIGGLNASKGTNRGNVFKLNNMDEVSEIMDECIVVASKIGQEIIIASDKIKGIVTDEGGANSHMSIICRELGIPLIVNTKTAYENVSNGQEVVIDGFKGIVYCAKEIEMPPVKVEDEKEKYKTLQDNVNTMDDNNEKVGGELITATKVMIDLADAANESVEVCDGIGIFRGESILYKLGKHPVELIKGGYSKNISAHIEELIERFAKKCGKKPINYLLFCGNSVDLGKLAGGEKIERDEANPKLGMNGIRRAMVDPSILNVELEAIKNLLHKGYTNLRVMLSFVTNPAEIDRFREIMKNAGIDESMVSVGVNIVTPASAYLEDEFKTRGVAFVNIETDRLAEYVLCIDKEHAYGQNYYNPKSSAVMKFVEDTVKRFNKAGINVSVSGSVLEDQNFFEKIIGLGVDSIISSPEKAKFAKVYTARCERKLLLDIMRSKNSSL